MQLFVERVRRRSIDCRDQVSQLQASLAQMALARDAALVALRSSESAAISAQQIQEAAWREVAQRELALQHERDASRASAHDTEAAMKVVHDLQQAHAQLEQDVVQHTSQLASARDRITSLEAQLLAQSGDLESAR
jgi:hypothetical protein